MTHPTTTELTTVETINGPPVLTLHLSAPLQTWINDLRATYFPAHRLLVPGHLTLFHALPSSPPSLARIFDDLQALTDNNRAFDVHLGNVFKMGQRGVSVEISNGKMGLSKLRDELLARWQRLESTNQDRQKFFRPHFTVMNKKTDPDRVEMCFAHLRAKLSSARTGTREERSGKALGIDV